MNALLLLILFLGTAVIQVFIGGMRPIFAIPGYTILGLAGISSLFLLRKSRPSPSILCLISTVIFLSYILVRAYYSPVEYLSRHDRFMVLGCLIVYFVFALYVTDPRQRIWFFYGIFLLAIGHILVGAIQFSKGENFLPFGYVRADYGSRASGFYVCPNHYAGLLEILAVMAVSIGVWSRVGLKTRLLLLYFSPFAIAGLALSGSRGGYVSTAVAFTTFAVLSLFVVRAVVPQRFVLMSSLAVGLLLLGGFGGVTLLKKSDFLASRFNAIVDPANMRIYLWRSAMIQMKTQPVTGTGAGTYYYLGRTYRDPRVQTDPVWVHNDYYHLATEYGWLGAGTCALFLGVHLWQGIAGCRRIMRKRLLETQETTSSALALNIGALAGIAAILAHSVVDFNLHIPGNSLVVAALFGILANPPMQRQRNGETSAATVLPFRLLLPLCALGIFLDATPHLPGEWHAEQSRMALRDGNYLRAIAQAKLGIEKDKTDPDLYYYLGESRRLFGNQMNNELARTKMNEAALSAFQDSLKLFPQDEKLWVKASQALDLLNRPDEALASLDKAHRLDPNLFELNRYYGAHYQLIGDNKKALLYYQGNPPSAATENPDSLHEIKADPAR